MSFILEALKKSEQQRQQKSTSQQKVHQRTLALPSQRQGRWPYWLLVGFLSLVLLFSWWLSDHTEPILEQIPVVSQSTNAPKGFRPPETSKPVPPTSAERSSQPSVTTAEPAPVPLKFASSLPATVTTAPEEMNVSSAQPQRHEAVTSDRISTDDERVETVVIEQSMPREVDNPAPEKLPLYLDLSRGLRDQMPRLAMSMHYYIADPARRMVRINNLILHEGDWVGQGLQVVEISQAGATLDFMGKLFEMRSSR